MTKREAGVVLVLIGAIVGVLVTFVMHGIKKQETEEQYSVVLYGCDDQVLRQWVSSGKVKHYHSNWVYFVDSETDRKVKLTGTVVIERIQ